MRKIWGEANPKTTELSKLDLKSELEDVEHTYGVKKDY
jgi:hypothetical protein